MHRKDWLGSRGNEGTHRRERIKGGYLVEKQKRLIGYEKSKTFLIQRIK